MQSLVRRSDGPVGGDADEPCRFPKLQECAHFHYERVQLCPLQISLQPRSADNSLHSHHKSSMDDSTDDDDWYTVQVTSDDECWLLQRNYDNFVKLDSQLHQCIYDRKVSQLPELTYRISINQIEGTLTVYLKRFCEIVDNSLNCGPILTWFQLDNKGHRLLVPNEECDSINTPAVAAAYSIKKYVSQARDELNLEVGDMISVIDMASPGESIWWRGKRGFQVGFFPQHCVHVIGEKLACLPNAPSALSANPIKPVLRKHGKLIAFFRSFILNRPSRRRLKQSGILKERVFGCDLGEHLLNSGHEIPMVLKCCAEFIENHGLVDGIYRLSGVTSNIQKLRHAFDEDRIPELYTEDILQDIHSVASLLKMYFRELPNPLCTYQLYRSFVRAIQYGNNVDRSDDNERLLRIRETVHKLPPPHYRTLEYLMRHLARVAKHGARTGMTTRNVAIVWAPNLLRCAELEVGGVAALQGVGVQAVVTEFLICYTDLIFCDNLPMELSASEEPSSPKKLRPKSLMISTPTRLLSLEEAQNKQHLLSKSDESSYIEVGGGPKNLPEKYHTVLDLPQGVRKRGVTKRSPLGWRSFFTKSRSNTHASITKTSRKASTPGITTENAITTTELSDIQRKLRPVKSAESLISGQSEPLVTDIDTLGPLYCLNKPPGHNRSVSHDSYFDTLQQNSNNNSEGSLLDLSEIQLNFELEESEMRIFSEDESLVSSPRIKDGATRKILQSKDDFNSNTNSLNPSPKKQARIVLSPESQSRKRSRLEDQLSDILYIDCSTPDNTIQTTAIIHSLPEKIVQTDETEPKNKSPRNSDEMASKLTETKLKNIEDKFNCFSVKNKNRNSLNLESSSQNVKANLPKSLTEVDIISKSLKLPDNTSSGIPSTNLSPQTPNYKRLIGETDSSETTTPNQLSPDFSLTESPTDISYTKLNRFSGDSHKFETSNDSDKHDDTMIVSNTYENITNDLGDMNLKKSPTSPTYENVLTTISITYSVNSPQKKAVDNIYEDVDIGVTKVNSNEASQVTTKVTNVDELLANHMECPTEKTDNKNIIKNTPTSLDLRNTPIILYKSHSLNNSPIGSPAVTFGSVRAKSSSPVFTGDGQQASSPVNSVTSNDNANNSLTSSQPCSNNGILLSTNEKRKSDYNIDEDTVYQQVKYFRRSVHEINELLDKPFSVPDIVDVNPESIIMKSTDTENDDCVVENVDVNEDLSGVDLVQNLNKNIDTDKVKSTDASIIDICENKSDTDLDNIDNKSDRFDSLDVFENVDNVSDVDTKLDDQCVENIDVTIEDSANKECENEFNNYKNIETESTKEDTSIVSISTDVDESSKANIESRSSKKNKIRELALKFEASDDKCARDSLPPCLRARQAKLMKNNSRTRSLDENAFAKECKDGSSNYINSLNTNFAPSVFRRKSFDERWNFCINASGPKTLNQPKTLPNFAKVSLEFHSMHTADPMMAVDKKSDVQNISMSGVEVNKEKELQVEKGVVKKEMKDTETFSQPISDMLSSSSSNIHSECNANPQLNRERIEKYKEERRNFLREKYRSESFRTEKDQVLSRLKQKTKSKHEHEDEYFKGGQEGCDTNSKLNKNIDNPVNRKVEIDDVHETWMKSRTKSTSEDKVIIIENESLSERLNPIKNPEPKPHQHKKCFSTDIFSHNWNDGKLTTDITSPELRTNQRYNKSDMPVYSERDFCKKPTVKAASEQDESRNSRDARQKSESESSDERRVSQIESLKLKYESDITKRGAEYKNVSDKGYVKKGVKKKEISDNIKIRGDQLRRKDYGKPDNLDLNTDRRHTFEGMSMRERELESEKSQRVSLESKLSFHSATKPEKHSPSYCIRDMTAMFESKSNKS